MKNTFGTVKRIITKSRFVIYLWGTRSDANAAGEQTISLKELDLDSPESSIKLAEYAVQSSAVEWILVTSTDTDTVTTAARMLPEIEWSAGDDVTEVLDRLKSHFYACFDLRRQVLPQSQARAVACLKALYHLCFERDLIPPFFCSRREIYSTFSHQVYNIHPDHDYRVVSCAADYFGVPDIAALSVSDQTWMAHMFTYQLHGGNHEQYFVTIAIDFIKTCLYSMPSQRLWADCLLLGCMLIGLSWTGVIWRGLTKRKCFVAIHE